MVVYNENNELRRHAVIGGIGELFDLPGVQSSSLAHNELGFRIRPG